VAATAVKRTKLRIVFFMQGSWWRRRAPLEPKPDPPIRETKKYLRGESVVTILDHFVKAITWLGSSAAHPNGSSIAVTNVMSVTHDSTRGEMMSCPLKNTASKERLQFTGSKL